MRPLEVEEGVLRFRFLELLLDEGSAVRYLDARYEERDMSGGLDVQISNS
jgi:hypothetical protein